MALGLVDQVGVFRLAYLSPLTSRDIPMFLSLRHFARSAKLFRRPQTKRLRTLHPSLELLEDRLVPTTFTVTNTHDSGTNSLRQAILNSNAHPGTSGPNLIDFDLPTNSNGEIVPNSALPAITSPVVINGIPVGGPLVVLIGNNTGQSNGLTLEWRSARTGEARRGRFR